MPKLPIKRGLILSTTAGKCLQFSDFVIEESSGSAKAAERDTQLHRFIRAFEMIVLWH